jgi:hypothetical protein
VSGPDDPEVVVTVCPVFLNNAISLLFVDAGFIPGGLSQLNRVFVNPGQLGQRLAFDALLNGLSLRQQEACTFGSWYPCNVIIMLTEAFWSQ